MINDKVVLTYKRKHVSSHSDPAHVNEGDASSKSSRRISKSAILNEPLEGDDKDVICIKDARCKDCCFKCNVHNSNGVVLDCSSGPSGPKTSECNDPSPESTTQRRWGCIACIEQHSVAHVEQYDNARELGQQQVQESDKSKRCESVREFEKGQTEHSHDSSPIREESVKDAALSKNLDLAFVDSRSTLSNGAPYNKETSGYRPLDWQISVRSNPVSLDSTEGRCTSLCRKECLSETFISGEKGFPLEEKPEMLLQKTVHKKSSGTPLRTFCRRAKKIKDANEIEVHGNLKVVRGEGSASEQSKMLDAICKSERSADQSREVPVLGTDNSDSNQSSLNLNGEDMVKKLKEGAGHEPSPGNLVENEKDKAKVSTVNRTDGSNFTIRQTESVPEDRPVKVRSNCYSDNSVKDSSSEVNRKDKQFNLLKPGTLIGDVSATGSTDAGQKPIIRCVANEKLKADTSLSNSCQSDGLHLDINLYEMASNKTTTDSLYKTRKPRGDASHENMVDSRGSSDGAVEEAKGGGKGLAPVETMDRQKQRVICRSMPEVDINCRPAFSEVDTLCQMTMNPSLTDAAVPQMQDFLRGTTNQTASPQKGNFVGNVGNSTLESQWGTQPTSTICVDFLSPVRTQRESAVDPIKNFRNISPISSLKDTGYEHEVQLPLQASDSNASTFRHKQILDDIITSSRMLNKRHEYYFANCRRYPSVWSEEELDSLWIGVRRHGRGNWNAMLGDPKLHFAGWRIADDLAERWDMEQSRLLAAPLVQPVRSLGPDHSPSSIISTRLLSNSAVDSSYRNYLPEFQKSRSETGLSLGGVYLKKEGKSTNRNPNPTQLSDFTVHPLAANGSLVAGSSYTYLGHQRHPLYTESGTTHQRIGKSQERYDLEPIMLEQNSVERLPGTGHQMAALSAGSNLPHWLKEVLGTPSASSEHALFSSVSIFEHSTVSHSPLSYPGEQLAPLKDARRGILKRRGTNGSNASVLGLSTLKSTESKVSDANILDLNRSSSEAIEQTNLIILDGDASSEETISDDQSSRR